MADPGRPGGGDGGAPPSGSSTPAKVTAPRLGVTTRSPTPPSGERVTAERVSAPSPSERAAAAAAASGATPSERAAIANGAKPAGTAGAAAGAAGAAAGTAGAAAGTTGAAAGATGAAAGTTTPANERPLGERERSLTPPRGEKRTTAQMGALRARALAESVLADEPEDPTRATSGKEPPARTPRFVSEENLRTALVPHATQRQRTLTPASATQESPAVEVLVGAPIERPRTQVWVATHKPPDDPDARLILVREPDSARAASFRVLRHRLAERGDPRVIAVTSAGPREGKTTCAANLALALGECGRARVLLIEANLRAPALAALFGFLPPECFSVQLQRHKDNPHDAWSVVELLSPSLHVLAVKPDAAPRPLLDGPAFGLAVELLRHAGYDYIVIDTPPVLGAADVNLIEDAADGVLFTAQARTTSSRKLTQAVEQLAPAKLLGLALLDV